MSNDIKPAHVDNETYMYNDEADGMWERDIECSNCGDPIGAHQHDTQDSTVELFYPYWMLDMDNNDNVCEDCYHALTSRPSDK